MSARILLIPKPKVLKWTFEESAITEIPKYGFIYTTNEEIARYLKRSAESFAGYTVTKSTNGDEFVQLISNPYLFPKHEGYRLVIDGRITIIAHDDTGLFYGVQTLRQILRQSSHFNGLPNVFIEDYPDFLYRGIMIDVSRDRIPKLEVLKFIIEKLSELKVNQLQLYTEHTFAYRGHEKVWEDYSPLTHEEIIELDTFCKSHFIELVPNQNTFGHLSKWLIHDEYKHLAEASDGYETPWGGRYEYPFSISPAVPESVKFVEDILREFLPNFSSEQVNIGCDETFDLGQGKSKDLCERYGKGKVYFDFLMKIYNIAKRYKKAVMFWGDIIENHPEFIPQLPKDMIAMVWGYEADHPFDEKCELYSKSGLSFYVCPGTSTWNTFIGRTDNAIENIKNAVYNGYKHGAIGVLTTDWGDNGHPQHLPFSWIGFAFSAALGWNITGLEVDELLDAVNLYVFETERPLAQFIHRLGQLHNALPYTPNGTPYFYAFVYPDRFSQNEKLKEISYETLENIESELKTMKKELSSLVSEESKLSDVVEQISNNMDFAKLGLQVLRFLRTYGSVENIPEDEWNEFDGELERVLEDYRRIWLSCNRKGGLEQSIYKLTRIRRVRKGDKRGLIF
ncbi:family 20 glycosylhydrolase [Fervidobacterium islandicum]|uniref:Family 20 glycosylhydrolase n=1 Tax=Fervidobacterium islandicum TaxID=2423 RepID=A0AAI8CKL4_FERIS|nr:family 20 glycosylhydrolase [Fervidobacterium islandicum]AMW32132.1 family 20 glycosylhydrolase [Fervidobacterium islandicum]